MNRLTAKGMMMAVSTIAAPELQRHKRNKRLIIRHSVIHRPFLKVSAQVGSSDFMSSLVRVVVDDGIGHPGAPPAHGFAGATRFKSPPTKKSCCVMQRMLTLT